MGAAVWARRVTTALETDDRGHAVRHFVDEPPRLARWIVVWLLVSSVIVLWDVAFVLLRPRSMPGGALSFLWVPYAKYIAVDLGYADLRYGFVKAQAVMSALEMLVVVWALVANWRRKLALATLLVFAQSTLIGSKTLLIFLVEAVTHGEHVGHNSRSDLVLLYVLPNAVWVVGPALVALATGRTLLARWAGHSGAARR
jgi:hypothetical protein